jgi:dolichol-phosphate mannosyltransferase
MKAPTLILVPTYNERQNILRVYRGIYRHVKDCDLLFIDDNSPDGTGKLADDLAKKDRRVGVLHRPGKGGLGTAYVDGLKEGLRRGYRHLLAMDADLQHDPTHIPRLVALMKDHDLVIGSRYVKGGEMENWSRGRHLISRLANGYAKCLLGLSPSDCTGGYKCYKAGTLRKIDIDHICARGYVFQVEILFRLQRAKARIAEWPIAFQIRHRGKSKLNLAELAEFGWTILKLRWLSLWGRIRP